MDDLFHRYRGLVFDIGGDRSLEEHITVASRMNFINFAFGPIFFVRGSFCPTTGYQFSLRVAKDGEGASVSSAPLPLATSLVPPNWPKSRKNLNHATSCF